MTKPWPAFVQPCLAKPVAVPPSGENWMHEIKYDGYRVQAHIQGGRVRVLTRNGHDWTEKFGKVADDFHALAVRSAIIDGEAIVQDATGIADFSALTAELKSGQSARILIMAFDLLYLDGGDRRNRPLFERKDELRALLSQGTSPLLLRYSEHMQGDGAEILAGAYKIGVEGIVSKSRDKPYRSGRGGDWLKAKCLMADPFVIIGYVNSKAASDAVGSLVLGYYDGPCLIYAGRVGTGFTERVAAELWHQLQPLIMATPRLAGTLAREQQSGVVWVWPNLVARIEYRAWTGDKILRHATFRGLRTDKTAREIGHPLSMLVAGS